MSDVRTEENEKMLEKSVQYKNMAESWAFKDFMEYLLALKTESVRRIYEGPDASLQEIKGSLKTLDKIEKELDYILSFKG